MNKEHVPYVLYDLALTIGSEVRLVPMLTRTLQRLLFHTGFPVGMVLMEARHGSDLAQARLAAIVGDHVLAGRHGTMIELPSSLLPDRPCVLADEASLLALGGSQDYHHGISLPFGDMGTILLLSTTPIANTQLLTQVLQPVLRNLDRAARLCRDSERLTATLESDLARKTLVLQTVIDTVPAWVFWKDRDSVFLGCNPGFARAGGRATAEEIVGVTDHELAWASQADAYRADDRAVMESGRPKLSYDEPTTTPDGRTVWLRTSKVPLKTQDDAVIGVLGICEDITERRQAEIDLRETRSRLEQLVNDRTRELAAALDRAQSADRAKSAFLATTSHELRTPLNAIIGFTSLILEGSMGDVREEQRKPLEIVRRSGEQLLDLVRDILDMTLIEGGNLKIDAARANLRNILEEQWEAFGLRARERSLEWRAIDCDESTHVFCDRARMSQVVRNLMANAINFTDEGYVQVRGTVQDGAALIEVIDSGIGVPADQMDKLFQPFQPIQGQPGPIRQRTGLGLAICRRLVEAMNGTIGVDSAAGKGSRFWFTVPLA